MQDGDGERGRRSSRSATGRVLDAIGRFVDLETLGLILLVGAPIIVYSVMTE